MARLVTEKEAAEYVGLELATFRAWVSSGRLPGPSRIVESMTSKHSIRQSI
jgi:predicted DNA-binding transcriptional regulator AlpA